MTQFFSWGYVPYWVPWRSYSQTSVLPLLTFLWWNFLSYFPFRFTVYGSYALFALPVLIDIVIIAELILLWAINIRIFAGKYIQGSIILGCKFVNNTLLSSNHNNLKRMIFFIYFNHYLSYVIFVDFLCIFTFHAIHFLFFCTYSHLTSLIIISHA